MNVERATQEGRRLPVIDLLERDISGQLALAKRRLREGEEHGGRRAKLCAVEAEIALAEARRLTAMLKGIEERGGR
jgi:hypothetical protein